MPYRNGFSEQAAPNNILWGKVVCLQGQSLLIFNVNHFYKWNSIEKFIEVPIIDFSNGMNSSRNITMVANSKNMFILDYTNQYPDHNDFENITSILFEGKEKIREMPCRLYHPNLLTNQIIIGIDDNNNLVECKTALNIPPRTISSFDNKITGLFTFKNGHILIADDRNLLSLYQLQNNELSQIIYKKIVGSIKAIQDFDDNFFACSIYDNLGNEKNTIKDCKTRLQLWKKDSLSCIQEIEINGVSINKLQLLPNSNDKILIGSDRYSIFRIDFEKHKVNIINMESYYVDFSIADNGKLVILINDKKRINHLIQIEPDLLGELLNLPEQAGQVVIHTHINSLRQTLSEEKTNGDDILTLKGSTLFSPKSQGTADASNLANKTGTENSHIDIDEDKEERKDRGTGPQAR